MQLNVEETLWGRSWVSSKHTHMGHRAHQSAVLDDGAAAHACHDAAGGAQQLRVGDLQEQVAAVGARAAAEDLDVEEADLVAPDIGEDLRRAGVHLGAVRHRQGFPLPALAIAEDPPGGVAAEGADGNL